MTDVDVNGARLWCTTTGDQGPVLLFHHGYMGTHDIWLPAVELLRDRYRCVLMDARGVGRSEHTEGGYEIEQVARDVLGVADALGIDRFTYVGHSLGGAVGYLLGLDAPDRLERLVTVCSAPIGGARGPAPALEAVKAAWRAGDADTLAAALAAVQPRNLDLAEVAARAGRMVAVSAGHVDGLAASLADFDLTGRIGEMQVPTLVVSGAADAAARVHLEDYARLPNATLHVFSRVGHVPSIEAPEAFAEVLDDFLVHGVVTLATLRAKAAAATA
ncbi:MAG: hydrolase, alpha/beta fold domain containing protein [Actinomycetia bacterium]|nr:hydrolase, alpha/beta fold domain containing protein [Actinomycetes bacterium]